MSTEKLELFEVFIRSKRGLDHRHVGSLHAEDHQQALEYARDCYTRRSEGVSLWVVKSADIVASQEDDSESFYDPSMTNLTVMQPTTSCLKNLTICEPGEYCINSGDRLCPITLKKN